MPDQSVLGARALPATSRPAAVAACLVAVLALAGCSTWGGFARPHPGQLRQRPEVPVGTARAKLHLSRRSGDAPPRMLLFHVTGDSGWHGLDPLYVEAMTARGYALAGVSARALCADLDASGGARATAARAAEDYLALIATAEARLRLAPGTPIVITGLSRGAGLAVVTASQPALARRIAGVLLMGLTGVEDYVRPKVDLFTLLGRIDGPLVLLQSIVDRYVPAAEA